MADSKAPQQVQSIAVDEHAVAAALGMSVHWVRKDRRNKRVLPFYRLGDRILYNLDRVREALALLEEGGPATRRTGTMRRGVEGAARARDLL